MVFEIENKVALITGGAAGLGFNYAKELLRNGAKVSLYRISIETEITREKHKVKPEGNFRKSTEAIVTYTKSFERFRNNLVKKFPYLKKYLEEKSYGNYS